MIWFHVREKGPALHPANSLQHGEADYQECGVILAAWNSRLETMTMKCKKIVHQISKVNFKYKKGKAVLILVVC